MKTYLVTGVVGFIAARVATLLLEKGHSVVGLDNLNEYYDTLLKKHRLETLHKLSKHTTGHFQFHTADIEDTNTLNTIFQQNTFDAVINLAARAGVRKSLEEPAVYMETNADGNLNILEAMRAHGVKKFVLASTSSLYAGQSPPFSETLPVDTPLSPYAVSKRAAELMAYTYHKLYGFDVAVLRYFTVYGPAGRPDMSVFRFIEWINTGIPLEIFGDGSQLRDFTYVDDIARGTVAAAMTPLGYEIINLGGGAPLTLNAAISCMETELGRKAERVFRPFHAADMEATVADITKAGRLLNWVPQVSAQEGLRRTVAWHKENREWLRNVNF